MPQGINRYRQATQVARQRFEGKAPVRPILTGTARGAVTPSDLEGFESVSVIGQNADGSFVFLEGYDNLDDYL